MFTCQKCGATFKIDWRKYPKKGSFPRFCSVECSHSHLQTPEQNKNRSKKLKGKPNTSRSKFKRTKEIRKCAECGKELKNKNVSGLCGVCYYGRVSIITSYRNLCKFTFNVFDYPEEFDLSLLKDKGWYAPKNRGNNLEGVSRDHMVSITYGLLHNIDPKLIAHPANCKLMVHSENNKKKISCSITIDELIERVNKWNTRYTKCNK